MKKKITEKPTERDVMALRMLVRAREDFQGQRKRIDNRIGRKADGTPQNVAVRAFNDVDLSTLSAIADVSAAQEEAIEKELHKVLKRFPIYTEYLVNVKGVGDIAAAHIISNFDIVKATTVSKMWQFAGLNPGMVYGKKAVGKKEYKPTMGQIIAEYEADAVHEAKVVVLTDTMIKADRLTPGFLSPFNGKLRTALVGVMADGFIKSQSPYVQYYYNMHAPESRVKNGMAVGRLDAEDGWKDESAGHRDRAAKRYMVKMFLKDLYVAWRELEGLPVRAPYQEEYLGHKHSA